MEALGAHPLSIRYPLESHLARSDAVVSFVGLAERFCELIAGHEELSASALLHRAHALLPQLYASALFLPDVGLNVGEEQDAEEGVDDEVEYEAYSRSADRLSSELDFSHFGVV